MKKEERISAIRVFYDLIMADTVIDAGEMRYFAILHKTTTPIFLPLSSQAMKWHPERGEAKEEDHVFATLPAEQNVNINLQNWAKAAGITKHLSFHTSRHTFATMMLTLGADLYTVSLSTCRFVLAKKLLGHSNVKITQIYAKIVDQKSSARPLSEHSEERTLMRSISSTRSLTEFYLFDHSGVIMS